MLRLSIGGAAARCWSRGHRTANGPSNRAGGGRWGGFGQHADLLDAGPRSVGRGGLDLVQAASGWIGLSDRVARGSKRDEEQQSSSSGCHRLFLSAVPYMGVIPDSFSEARFSPGNASQKLTSCSVQSILMDKVKQSIPERAFCWRNRMLYTVEHQEIESTIAGPYSVVVFKHKGAFADRRSATVASSVTGLRTPELCDARAMELAEHFGATIVNAMLTEKFALAQMERMLPCHAVIERLRTVGASCSQTSIRYYADLESLTSTVRSSRNWNLGETFVWVSSQTEYVILTQVAPASCEMMVVTPTGVEDVISAYRFEQDELIDKLLGYVEAMEEAAASV